VRIAFLGNTSDSAIVLRRLARAGGLDVAIVLTRTPRPGRRGADPVSTPVATEAERDGLPLLQADRAAGPDVLAALRTAGPDALVVVAFGEILPAEILQVGPRGSINLHFSLLPRWRGAAPVQRAILAGDDVTGVTTMLMDEGLDTGPILLQRATPIGPGHTRGTLGTGLSQIGADLLVETLGRFDEIDPRPQEPSLATAAPKVTSAERRIEWTAPATVIDRLVRALAPAPGATTTLGGTSLKVSAALPIAVEGEPGTVIGLSAADGMVVGAGEGSLRLTRVVPEGRAGMSAVDWAHGARIRPGERFT
jgi:methionyl-tRNA formyltransferase